MPQNLKKSKPYSIIQQLFSAKKSIFWRQYDITNDILKAYKVVSLKEFRSENSKGKPFCFSSSDAEPIFGYAGKRHVKIYRPFSQVRFLYGGNLSDNYCFGLEQLPAKGDTLFITGGEKDVMSLASQNFLKALEKLPATIERHKTDIEKLVKDISVLQEVVNSTWRKENELKDLKSELAALDRKIQLSLKPIEQGEEKPNEIQNSAKSDLGVRQELLSGKINPKDIVKGESREMKDTMGDRLIIAGIPKYNSENQQKVFKL